MLRLHIFPPSKHDAVYETVCQMALFTMLFFVFKLLPTVNFSLFKGALYRIWCGVNRPGDSGVKVV